VQLAFLIHISAAGAMAIRKLHKDRFWLLFIVAVLAVAAGWIWLSRPAASSSAAGLPAPRQGFLAPDFTLATRDGKKASLSDFQGKVVLINFWASWCPPCEAEMPSLQAAYQAYGNQGFTVLAIDSTGDQDEVNAASQFAVTHNLDFPMLYDVSGETSQLYQVQALPTSFFVDHHGKIAWVVVGGPMADALIRSHVEALLKATP
jgi:cytochrome c biogenesis protein CcmG, thiol:disulfide interchange protein DsbE